MEGEAEENEGQLFFCVSVPGTSFFYLDLRPTEAMVEEACENTELCCFFDGLELFFD